jgi:hypothetical protein
MRHLRRSLRSVRSAAVTPQGSAGRQPSTSSPNSPRRMLSLSSSASVSDSMLQAQGGAVSPSPSGDVWWLGCRAPGCGVGWSGASQQALAQSGGRGSCSRGPASCSAGNELCAPEPAPGRRRRRRPGAGCCKAGAAREALQEAAATHEPQMPMASPVTTTTGNALVAGQSTTRPMTSDLRRRPAGSGQARLPGGSRAAAGQQQGRVRIMEGCAAQ